MAIAKIQTGDTVKIIAGNHKGITGQVLAIVKKTKGKKLSTRANVAGVPGIAKFRRSFKYDGQGYPGSMYTVPRLVDVSNLSHLTTDGKLSKVKIQIDESGKKQRVLKKTDATITRVKIAKVEPVALPQE